VISHIPYSTSLADSKLTFIPEKYDTGVWQDSKGHNAYLIIWRLLQ